MRDWTAEELDTIGAADELQPAALRPDGSLRPSTTIWVVCVGDDLYVRSWRGRNGGWFRSVLRRPEGRIRAGGITRDVTFQEAHDADQAATCVCGSDLWPYRGIEAVEGPSPMGHEYAGVVEEGRAAREELFSHVHLHGGPAPVRRFLPELIDLICDHEIGPGKVFDLTLPLEEAAEGYKAMDERRAIKTLLRP